jgi:polymorphic membrane protein
MNYFQLVLLPTEASIAAAWDTALVEFDAAPRLTAALTARRAVWLPRFADCYLQLISSPRGARRRLVRRLRRSRHLDGFWPFERRRRGKIVCSVAGAALLLALAQTADAGTITVNTNAADVNDADGRCSLAEAIINANDDAATHPDCAAGSGADTIILPKGALALTSSYPGSDATALPVITTDITISANRTKISRAKNASAFRFFAVAPSGSLTLEHVTLSGGSADIGGAILNYGNLTINNSTLSGNTAAERGGGIYSHGASAHVSINGSSLTANQAYSGGGIFNYNDVSIIDSTLSGNTATSEGAAIAHYDGYLRIERSTIAKNHAVRAAAGIDNVYGTTKIFHSVISGNSAMYGAAIENYGRGSTIGNMMIYSSTISKNSAGVYGGGIANIDGLLVLADSAVTGNKASDRGGGVFNNFGATLQNSNSMIAKNKAPNGADVYP